MNSINLYLRAEMKDGSIKKGFMKGGMPNNLSWTQARSKLKRGVQNVANHLRTPIYCLRILASLTAHTIWMSKIFIWLFIWLIPCMEGFIIPLIYSAPIIIGSTLLTYFCAKIAGEQDKTLGQMIRTHDRVTNQAILASMPTKRASQTRTQFIAMNTGFKRWIYGLGSVSETLIVTGVGLLLALTYHGLMMVTIPPLIPSLWAIAGNALFWIVLVGIEIILVDYINENPLNNTNTWTTMHQVYQYKAPKLQQGICHDMLNGATIAELISKLDTKRMMIEDHKPTENNDNSLDFSYL